MARKLVHNIDLEKRDRAKYLISEGDADYVGDEGYVKKRNDFVIEDAINKTNAMMREKQRLAVDQFGERADAVVHYLKAIDRGKEPNIPKYFGKKYLAYLRGDEIRQELMKGLVRPNAPKK